jgi:acyl carrier protein
MTSSLSSIVAEVLGITEAEVADEVSPATCGTWTSLRHVQLLAATEREYGVSFSAREMRTVRSVGQLRRTLQQKGTPV